MNKIFYHIFIIIKKYPSGALSKYSVGNEISDFLKKLKLQLKHSSAFSEMQEEQFGRYLENSLFFRKYPF